MTAFRRVAWLTLVSLTAQLTAACASCPASKAAIGRDGRIACNSCATRR